MLCGPSGGQTCISKTGVPVDRSPRSRTREVSLGRELGVAALPVRHGWRGRPRLVLCRVARLRASGFDRNRQNNSEADPRTKPASAEKVARLASGALSGFRRLRADASASSVLAVTPTCFEGSDLPGHHSSTLRAFSGFGNVSHETPVLTTLSTLVLVIVLLIVLTTVLTISLSFCRSLHGA